MKRILILVALLVTLGGGFILLQHEASPINPLLPKKESSQPTQKNKSSTGNEPGIPLTTSQNLNISEFADGLGRARDLEFTPDGTLLVSDLAANAVYALPDKNNDGIADEIKNIYTGDKPHGIAFYEGKLFIAEVNRVSRFSWNEEGLSAAREKILFTMPGGANHSSRTIVFDRTGNMYVSIGSTCNVCFERDEWIAAVIQSNKDGKSPKLFAKGLRNAPFLTLHPTDNEIWATEMGRDFLGDNLPPDEINILKANSNYGWPICYGNKVYDRNFNQRSEQYCQSTISPIFEIPAHSAPLGLAFVTSDQFPQAWKGDLLVAYHGSWNRSVPTGYKVVRMNVQGKTIASAEDFLTGFTQGTETLGRPVDVIFDKEGSLYVSDDKRGVVYKITKK